MRVAIAGAHGQVATRLSRRLVERGDDVVGLIRNRGHAEDLRAAGVDPEICVYSVYLRAKAEAGGAVTASDRDWTIVRPGQLTDDPGTGRVRIDSSPFRGEIPRDDLATFLADVLHDPRAAGHILYVNSGLEPIGQALDVAFTRTS